MSRPNFIRLQWCAWTRALESCWQTTNPDPAFRRQLVARQVETWKDGHWINLLFMLSAATLIAILAGTHMSTGVAALWIGALLLNPLPTIGGHRWDHFVALRTRLHLGVKQRMLLQALTTGVLYQSVASWLYLVGSDSLSLVIGLITCGMLCSGAMGFARMPQVGLVWLVVLGAANIATLLCSQRKHDAIVALAMLGYLVVLSKDMLMSSRGFVRRCEAEFEAERQSHMVSLLLREFEGSSQDWFWETDASGHLTHASPRLSDALGTNAGDLLGRRLVSVLMAGTVLDSEQREALQALADRLAGQAPFRDLVVPLRAGADRVWWSLGARPLVDSAGAVQGWRGIGTDVSALRRHEQELQRLVHTDSLTGQTSRHGFQQHLQACLAADPEQHPFALMMIDLDGFKGINDAHGHAVGDALLQAVAQRLAGMTAPDALLARLGGDEFALILPSGNAPDHATAVAAATAVGQKMLLELRRPFQIGMLRVEARASLGLAWAPEHGRDDVALLRAADMALYAAKAAGRDRLQVFDHDTGQRAHHRALLTRELSEAVAQDQLHLLYQPVFDANTGQPTGAEALLRWQHPRLGTIAPGEFISMAEESGLITSIGTWVLHKACTEAVHWHPGQRLAVNVSARQLHCPQFVKEVQRILNATGLLPGRLELELTESALAEEVTALAQLSALRTLGVRLALDDFGTGYSSLSYLQRFRFDRIKIDRSFVLPLQQADNAEQVALVRAVIDLASALRLRCTAEGIEDDAQAATLRALGCDELQGFQLGKPMPAAALRQCISASTPEITSS